MPTIAVSVLWLWILNPDLGLLNALLGQIGLPHIPWLASETLVLPTLILISLWNLGPMMIIFLAALQDVPQQLYDAVSVDGGGAWARLRHVTIPLITPAILFNLVIGLFAALQTFTQAYVMTDGGPNNANLFLVFYIYREGFRNSNIGYASALSWGLFAIIAVLSAIVFTSAKRWVHYEGGER
jgi:multiple sugar transport system permease protein